MSLFDLTGKVAVITGSSRGIGRAIAEEMADHGAKVVISSRNQEPCEDIAADINARHGKGTAIAVAASISDRKALENLVARTRTELGPIDILVCNAASNPHYGSLDTITIAPPSFARMSGKASWMSQWLDSTLLSMILRNLSSVIVSIDP